MASTCNRTAMPIADVDWYDAGDSELQCTPVLHPSAVVYRFLTGRVPNRQLLVVYQVGGFLRLGAVFLSGRRRATWPMIPADSANRCGASASADSRCWPVLDGSWRYCHRNGNTVDAPGGWTRKPKLHSSTASTHRSYPGFDPPYAHPLARSAFPFFSPKV